MPALHTILSCIVQAMQNFFFFLNLCILNTNKESFLPRSTIGTLESHICQNRLNNDIHISFIQFQLHLIRIPPLGFNKNCVNQYLQLLHSLPCQDVKTAFSPGTFPVCKPIIVCLQLDQQLYYEVL